MYKVPYYTEENAGIVLEFMRKNYFAIIIAGNGDFPAATHIPLETEESNGEILLKGHMMKNSDHYNAFKANENVLVIFNGPHSYISASWYEEPPMASTWDYMTVHVLGKIVFSGEAETLEAVKKITAKHEPQGSKASFENFPEGYAERLVNYIAAFEIKAERVENVFKLSQNRPEESRRKIAAALKNQGNDNATEIANEILKRI